MVRAFTLVERPDLLEPFQALAAAPWPEFLGQDPALGRHWPSLDVEFLAFQVAVVDDAGTVVGAGRSIPLVWDGTAGDLPMTIGAVLERGRADRAAGRAPTAVSALAAVVAPERQGQGHSVEVLRAMRRGAAAAGARSLIAPVRPTWKERYPLTPFERYVRWVRPGDPAGAPFDPWIRVHWRLGAETLSIAPAALTIAGSVADWERWTGMALPETGEYVIPGALQPVVVDRERDAGRYEDPNLWMRHPLTTEG